MKRLGYSHVLAMAVLTLSIASPEASWGWQGDTDSAAARVAQSKLVAALRVEIYPGIFNAIQETDDPCLTVFKPYKVNDTTPEAALADPFKLDWRRATNVQFDAGEDEKNPWWRDWIEVSVSGGYVPIHVAKSQITSALEAANELKMICRVR